ncbi:MAG: right-handed parallel beta-helix repeat-containing protein [Candidatus Celaenobacter antarcticus]|nr:right-handed parallel beta-helix repeat-containing protein [Candidatus Celaenobacter antarcticus]
MSKRILILLLIITLVVFTFCTKKSTSPEEQLLPPTDLTISLVENNKIQINWVDNSTNETAYLIDRKMGTFNWLENFGEVTANITSFTDNIPTSSDTVFSYRIRAFDDENYSSYSDTIAWFSTNSAPANLQIEQIAQDSIKLTWQDNSIGEQYFRIDRKIDEKGWQTNYAHVPADTTYFLDYTTALYDTCNYKIFAVSGISYSDSTENAFIPFLPAPTTLQLQALSATEVKLTWQDNCENEDGYLVYKRLEETAWNITPIPANTEEWTDEDVIPGIMNYYKVCAYIGYDHSGYVEDSLNTLPVPTNLQIEQQNVHTFKLNWQDNSNFEQGFKIDRKIDDEDWVNEIGIVDSNITTWTDSTLGRNYNVVYYRSYAYYEEYNSTKIESNSNIVFPAPSDLSYTILDINSISLTWTDKSEGEEGFILQRKVFGDNWEELIVLPKNSTEYTDNTLNNEDIFLYRVYAYAGENQTAYSNAVSFPYHILIPEIYPTIQIGINYANDGDLVLVQPGTYIENINYTGKDIIVGSFFLITQDASYISQTIIDGNQNGIVVEFSSGEDSTAYLIGFTITNGDANLGGGIYCNNSSPLIINNNINNNTAGCGGGIYCGDNSHPIIKNNKIFSNKSSYYGGGIYCLEESNPYILNTSIFENLATYSGGGIACHSNSNPIIINTNICKNANISGSNGSGIWCWDNSNPFILNSIISENIGCYGIYINSNSSANINYSCFWNNEGGNFYNCSGGIGTIELNPLFKDSENGNFHLKAGSPCIDAGNPDPQYNDPDGTRNDMGAYGGPGGDW